MNDLKYCSGILRRSLQCSIWKYGLVDIYENCTVNHLILALSMIDKLIDFFFTSFWAIAFQFLFWNSNAQATRCKFALFKHLDVDSKHVYPLNITFEAITTAYFK